MSIEDNINNAGQILEAEHSEDDGEMEFGDLNVESPVKNKKKTKVEFTKGNVDKSGFPQKATMFVNGKPVFIDKKD